MAIIFTIQAEHLLKKSKSRKVKVKVKLITRDTVLCETEQT